MTTIFPRLALPNVAQVFQVESWVQLTGGRFRHEIRYGLTSLPAWMTSPERLLELVRAFAA